MNALSLVSHGFVWPRAIELVVQTVPLSPAEAQGLLVKTLELPLPSSMTEALGIHQSDIIIRSALIAGIADLRANPWLLRYVFASLPRDSLTMLDYGESEVTKAEQWFLKTEIPVFMNTNRNDPKFPCISIALQESVETETTMGDVHYVSAERTEAAWPVLAGPFQPEVYNPGSGIMRLPAEALDGVVLAPGMLILDRVGREHPILEVLDVDTVSIAAGTVADFGAALLKGSKPDFVTPLESVSLRETYQIGLHVHGESTHLSFLYSIVAFILHRYKQALLEARGFERSNMAWSNFTQNDQFMPEIVYSRFCNITGYVRNYWPKAASRDIDGITGPVLHVSTPGGSGENFANDNGTSDGTESWLADQDALTANLTD